MQTDRRLEPIPARLADPSKTADSVLVGIGILLGFCLVGLTHAETYLEQHRHGVAVELGAGISDQAEFEEDVNAAPAHRKLGFLGLLSVAAYCFYTSPSNTRIQLSMMLFWMACSLLVVMSSYFWSFSRNETARELVRIVAYAGVAYSFARRFQPRELLKVLAIMAMVSVAAACAVDVAMGGRPWQPDYRLHGTLHSNLLAHQALVVMLIAFTLYKTSSRPTVWKSVFAAMLAVVILTKTRGALASSLIGLTAIVMVGQSFRSFIMVVSLAGVALSAGALLVLTVSSHAQQRLSETAALGRSEGVGTLTGRIPLWEAVLDESKDNRLKGYGYGAFWNTDRTTKLAKQLDWFPGHSHSAYVQTVLDVGYFGAAMVLMLVLAALVRSALMYFATGEPAYRFVFGLLCAGLVDGFVEVSFVYPRELGLFVGVALFMLIVRHPQQDQTEVEEVHGGVESLRTVRMEWQSPQPAY
ncbi:MAG: O-antigen ligase family protein [Planctomycetota bacterium]